MSTDVQQKRNTIYVCESRIQILSRQTMSAVCIVSIFPSSAMSVCVCININKTSSTDGPLTIVGPLVAKLKNMHEKSKWFRQQQLNFNFCWRKHCRENVYAFYFAHFETIVTEMLNCFSYWQIKATSKTTHCDFSSPFATSYVSIAQLTGAKSSTYVYIQIYFFKIDICCLYIFSAVCIFYLFGRPKIWMDVYQVYVHSSKYTLIFVCLFCL